MNVDGLVLLLRWADDRGMDDASTPLAQRVAAAAHEYAGVDLPPSHMNRAWYARLDAALPPRLRGTADLTVTATDIPPEVTRDTLFLLYKLAKGKGGDTSVNAKMLEEMARLLGLRVVFGGWAAEKRTEGWLPRAFTSVDEALSADFVQWPEGYTKEELESLLTDHMAIRSRLLRRIAEGDALLAQLREGMIPAAERAFDVIANLHLGKTKVNGVPVEVYEHVDVYPSVTVTLPDGKTYTGPRDNLSRAIKWLLKNGITPLAAEWVQANGGENEATTTRLSRGISARDLYDTGTCQVCFRNVKLDTGSRILRHGWEVRYGVHSAACRGTEEFPFEVSCSITEGFLVPMLRHALAPLEEQRDAAQKALAALTDPRQIEAAEKEMLLLDVQIRDLRRYIAEVTRAVERWRPTPLPMTPGWRRIDFLSGK